MEPLDFDLRLESSGESLKVRVQDSPAGEEAQAPVSLPRLAHDGILERLGLAVQSSRDAEPVARESQALESPREVAQRIGSGLFQALFTGSVRERFEASCVQASSPPGRMLRVRLRYSSSQPEVVPAVALPWEYMAYDGNFLGLDPSFSLIRYPEVAQPPSPPPFQPPLRIALLAGSPARRPLGIPRETMHIVEAWKGQGEVAVEALERRSAAALRSQLQDGKFHVLHFMGHGRFDRRDGRGAILLEDERGGPEVVDGETLAGLLAGLRTLRLVVLNACETAATGADGLRDPSLGVAAALIRAGLPAVIAMQYQISDQAAIVFGAALYERLARGESLDAAMTAGRLAIYDARRHSLEWGTPVLFLRSSDGRLFRTPAYLALHQLPAPPADFTGRELELAELRQSAQQGGAILVGMGGVGKTTLALKLAEELRPSFPDAQIYLDLNGVSPEPLSPTQAMAYVLRSFHLENRLPDRQEEMAALFRSLLDGKRMLLLMDNAAGREQLEPLIPPKGCLLLVTSRFRFTLPGFKVTHLEEILPEEARELLLTIEPRIGESAAEIAHLCGGLPFALRLAGSALVESPDLSPARYARSLADATERLGLIDASLTLSYKLLSEDLQKYWRKLAVFPETFDAYGAAALWEMEPDPTEEVLGTLVKSSLVDDDGRYRLHDLARVFADSRLEEGERSKARRQHAEHYIKILATANDLYQEGGESVLAGLRLFDLEWGNIQAGFAWAAEHAEVAEAAARLCSEYPDQGAYYLSLRQPARERIQWLKHGLAAARSLNDRSAEGRHLGNVGITYKLLGEARCAIEHYEEALQIAREIGDRHVEGNSLGNLGNAYGALGDTRRAIVYHEQHLEIAREIGDRLGEGNALDCLGMDYSFLGEGRRAIQYLEQALALVREIGDRRGEGSVLGSLGATYTTLGEVRRAIEYHEQALALAHEIGERHGESEILGSLGNAYAALGETRRAIEYYEQALRIAVEIGDRQVECSSLGSLGNAHADLGEARCAIEYYEQTLRIAVEIGDRHSEGSALGGLGKACSDLGDIKRAIEYVEQNLRIKREISDRQGEGSALGSLGIAYAHLGDKGRAIQYCEQWLRIAREVGDRLGEGQALGNLGNAYADFGDAQRAIEHYAQYLQIAREVGDRHGEGQALGNLGTAYADLGDAQRATEHFAQHLRIAREIGDRRGEGQALGNLGSVDADRGKARRAIKYYEQQLQIVREIGDRRSEGKTIGNLGNAYRILGDAWRTIEHCEQQLQITREIGDRRGEGRALEGLGSAYAILGEAQHAIEHYEQSLEIAREIGGRAGEASASWNLGLRYEAKGDLKRATELMQRQVNYAREIRHQDAEKWAARVEAIRRRLEGRGFARRLRRLFQRKNQPRSGDRT